ncbi:uncharacterized protein LOC142767047 isoform X2 [Rhipicephalus microplus]|uniref:uncharacterized protein LOC142767047 isoform X2 n=1 Tax=Rhipicephalus microplus TaxID=6941 RepID=UPI003F6C7254
MFAFYIRYSKCQGSQIFISNIGGNEFFEDNNAQACHQHSMQTPDGLIPCTTGINNMQACGGKKIVSCKDECKGRDHKIKISRLGRQCLDVPVEAVKYLSAAVNYTCELGECDGQNKCMPYHLLIGCWIEKKQIF